jgi:hypothetical protein
MRVQGLGFGGGCRNEKRREELNSRAFARLVGDLLYSYGNKPGGDVNGNIWPPGFCALLCKNIR